MSVTSLVSTKTSAKSFWLTAQTLFMYVDITSFSTVLTTKNKHSSQVCVSLLNLNLTVTAAAEKMEAITSVSISKSGKYLCVCHRAAQIKGGERGVFQIHSIPNQKLAKQLPETPDGLFTGSAILASAFAPKQEQFILTLTGDPEGMKGSTHSELTLLLWHWEQGKCQAKQQIGMRGQTAS